jgi:nitrate reductase NapD
MNISGVVVKTFPANIDAVWQTLAKMEGVEVHAANEDGRMVVTIEKQREGDIADLLVHMQDVPGVLSASMVYHQFEDLDQQEAEQ